MSFNIESMMNKGVYDHPTKDIKLIETHISWVILTGDFAYKIKKPVNFGFLDFSTLEKRHRYCKQELRLNSRLAPNIYLDVTTITGTPAQPQISGDGDAFEYAVKMTQFPQSAQLDRMLAADKLKAEHMDAIALMVAEFHQTAGVSTDAMDYGNKNMVYLPVAENFTQITEHLNTEPYADRLMTLERWCHSEFIRLEATFERRKRSGFIRECHGDMHLRNLVWLDGRAVAFDCIEFNPTLRWIDVISEIAFLVMDLQSRKQPQLANRFLNTYLETTGDYAGLQLLPFYLCYRALVRAKVNALRLEQKDIDTQEREKTVTQFESYLELATTYSQQRTPMLIIMRGLSASGKSTVSQQLLSRTGAIRIRSDVERKRIFATSSIDHSDDKIETGIYSTRASQQTYARLAELASQVITAGYSVIIDAAFLKHEQRKPFQRLAESLAVPHIIIEITAPVEILQQRIRERKNDVSDADIKVLEYQLANVQPLHADEIERVISVDSSKPLEMNTLIDKLPINH